MRCIAILMLCLLLFFCACSAPQSNAEQLQEQLTELQVENQELSAKLTEYEDEAEQLALDFAAVTAEMDRLRADYDAVEANYAALFEEQLALLDYHLIHREEYTGVFFADGQVEARGLPLEDASVIGMLENQLVTVYFTIQGQGELWSFVDILNLAESVDTLGWVKWEALKEYDSASMQERLTYPVRVQEGTLLYDEVHEKETISDGTTIYPVRYLGENAVHVMESGGISYEITRDALVYPSVRDGIIVWD